MLDGRVKDACTRRWHAGILARTRRPGATRAGARRPRHPSDRPRRGQPLSVFARRSRMSTAHSTMRSRTSTSAVRRCLRAAAKKLAARGESWSIPRDYGPVARRARVSRQGAWASDALSRFARKSVSRTRPSLRRRPFRTGLTARADPTAAAAAAFSRSLSISRPVKVQEPALRRKTRISRRRSIATRRRRRETIAHVPGSLQGKELSFQQSRRCGYRLGVREGARVRRRRGRRA